ncbi:YihY/virulence factor BrkB family protein [Halorubrum rubrum]|uniref:YihY/virulence factor BrkB family protein n=1 Tax=Halorubrum rubrum TaxID=1126240 RepID=A0ABD5QXP8_9EURY|nr:YihY/virulence factor BrkB family protein [Halorubrum rubrum]
MTSLSEAYGGKGRSEVDPRRLSIGAGLFVGGTLLLVAGILVAAEVLVPNGYTSGAARRLGGILGGSGVPLITLGVMAVLPADRRTRVASVVGAAIMALGVALFSQAYPNHWVGGPRPELVDLTLPTAGVYFLGAATTMWCVFVGVANFKTRNDPGGTVTMEVTHKGETKVIEVERDRVRGLGGGVGLLGGTPDGDVETQTNRSEPTETADAAPGPTADSPSRSESHPASTGESGSGPSGGSAPADSLGLSSTTPSGRSDGGSASADLSSPLDRPSGADAPAAPNAPSGPDGSEAGSRATGGTARDGPGDTYCGNCAEFDYVRTDDGMRPYCGHYDEVMDDMEACDQWTPQ